MPHVQCTYDVILALIACTQHNSKHHVGRAQHNRTNCSSDACDLFLQVKQRAIPLLTSTAFTARFQVFPVDAPCSPVWDLCFDLVSALGSRQIQPGAVLVVEFKLLPPWVPEVPICSAEAVGFLAKVKWW